ncbi:MAG TPA: Ig-like domain-containing protein, partial [Longimicrobiales bacterium]|nr:Ig-like domain-containing protein [Longimicrobiales bacterium]
PGTQSLALQATPLIQSVVTIPDNLSVEVGSVLDVQLVASDLYGNIIPKVSTAGWFTGSAGLAAGGIDFKGQVGGVYSSPKDQPFELRVELNGRIYAFQVTVTSFIQGKVTKDPAPAPSSPGGESPQPAALPTEPAPGVALTVRILEGPNVGTAVSDGAGNYRLGGLAQGTYEVLAAPQADLSPVPAAQTVVLDATHATGTANFHMSRGAVDSIAVSVTPDSLTALGATAAVTAAAFDTARVPMTGRTTTYTSSNPAVATVDAGGKVTAVANGTAWIRATVESRIDSVLVTVNQKAATLVLLDPKAGLPTDSIQGFVPDTGTVKYQAKDSRGNLIPPAHRAPTFASSNVSVATVNASTGFVQLVTVGTADITATMDGASDAIRFKALGLYAGDLWICSSVDITDVQEALIGRVTGSLHIGGCDGPSSLANVDGLGSIVEVMGNVEIVDNPSLTNLNGLSNLRHVGSSVVLVDNPQLSSTAVFPVLTTLPQDLFIYTGAKILGMPSLQTIGGVLVASGSDGPDTVLQELRLPALVSAGSVSFYSNHGLTTVVLPLLRETTSEYVIPSAPPAPSSRRALVPDLPDPSRVLADRAAQRRARVEVAEALRSERHAQADTRRAADRAGTPARSEAPVLRGMQLDLPGIGADARRQEFLARRAAQRADGRPVRPENPKPQKPPQPQRVYESGGELSFEDNPAITGLSFPALTYVSGDLHFYENDLVPSLAFPLLTGVGGNVQVWTMAAMTSLTAPILEDVSFDLYVDDNDALGQLVLPAMRWVGGNVWIGYNTVMTQFKLPIVETIGDDLDIYDHDALSVIEVATGSTLDIGYDLYVEYNAALTSVQMPGVTRVGDDFEIYENVINGSVVIGSAGPLDLGWDLELSYNEGSFTFSAPGLDYLYGDIDVYDNLGLTSFTAATTAGPVQVGYGVYFWDNPVLTTVTAPKVTTVEDWVEFGGNPALRSVNMAGLTSAYGLYLDSNGSPANPLTFSFPALAGLEADLELYGDYSYATSPEPGPQGVSSYSGGVAALLLPSLTYVGEDVWIDYNDILTTLDLSSLVSVGAGFEVYANDALSTFSMPELKWTGNDVTVYGNASLQNFSAPKLESTAGPIQSLTGAPVGPFAAPAAITGGDVWVSYNNALTGFNLSSLGKTAKVAVEGNQSLVTLPSLASLWPGASVGIYSNGLSNLAGLAGVTSLYELRVAGNPALLELSGLASLQEAWEVYIADNALLNSASLPGLFQVWNRLYVTNHTGLATVTFDNLATVGAGTGPSSTQGHLLLTNNAALTTASFPKLASLDGSIDVSSTGLVNLNGFSFLKSPVYGVYVNNNPALTNVLGLSGIGTTFASPAVTNAFQVTGNTSLCSSNVDQLIANIRAHNPGNPAAAIVPTPVTTGNATCTVAPAYNDINAAAISSMEASGLLSGNAIDGSDGQQFKSGTYFVYRTAQGLRGKFIVQSYEPASNHQLTLGWVTYAADGSVHSSGSGLVIRGTFLCDLDSGMELSTTPNDDFWWEMVNPTTRRLSPSSGAVFRLIHRSP